MKTTHRKPTLNGRVVELLRELITYAESETDMISDGTDDQKQQVADVRAAADWVRDLIAWRDLKLDADGKFTKRDLDVIDFALDAVENDLVDYLAGGDITEKQFHKTADKVTSAKAGT